MESDMLLDMEVNKKNDIDIDINMEIQFDGHGGQLIGPKLVRPKAYPTCVSSKLCEFIWPEVCPA